MDNPGIGGDITCQRGLMLPAAALAWRFSRGTGPGGQSVNTTDSRVELVANLDQLIGRADDIERVVGQLGTSIRVVVTSERSQLRNREIAVQRLIARIDAASKPIAQRRATKPSRSAVAKGKTEKRERSEVKEQRRRPGDDEA